MGVMNRWMLIACFWVCGVCLFCPSLGVLVGVCDDDFVVNDDPQPLPVPRGWWDVNWSWSKRIVIDHQMVGKDFLFFPVLISGIDTNLSGLTQEDGDDLVFVSVDNVTVFPHEIELFNPVTSELIAWVNVSNVSADSDTVIYMYYGNMECESQQNVSGTWDDGFVGVFHMNQSTGSLKDSRNTQDANAYENGTQYRQTGRIGFGVELLGDVDGGYFLMSHDAYRFHDADVTIEAWVHMHANKNSDDTIVYLGKHSLTNPGPRITLRKLQQQQQQGRLMIECGSSDLNRTQAVSDLEGELLLRQWKYVAGIVNYSGNLLQLFVDGVQQINMDVVWPYQLPDVSVASIGYDGMGDEQSSNWNYFDGRLDEIRVSRCVRSDEWLETTFNCINFPNTFSDFGFAFVISVDVEGSGVVIRDPDQTAYERNAVVNLTAIASEGWVFDRWAGDISGSQYNPQIVVDDNKYVMAYFVDIQPPTITNFTIHPLQAVEDNSIDFSWEVTDNSKVVETNLWLVDPIGNKHNITLNTTSPFTLQLNVSSVGWHESYVTAVDAYGNHNQSSSIWFEVIPKNTPPNGAINPFPNNNSDYVSVYDVWLNVTVFDSDENLMDVFFYWANDSYIGKDTSVSNGSVASVFLPMVCTPPWLQHNKTYTWYVVVNDSTSSITSPKWNFHTSKAWDINEDRYVDASDLSLLSNSYLFRGVPGWIGADINSDGTVEAADLSIFVNHYLEEYE